ncbi:MAG: winged helix-turn-helix transcriptional regulator [Clostridiales bacterium]|nr:winged helix-turn-helix transcriptional regulator [Clostridiales bacterium]
MNLMLLDSYTASRISECLPSSSAFQSLAEFFGALSDATRLKILSVLSASPMCVSDLSELTSLNQTTVSHQLRLLKQLRIVECRRQGKVIFYSLTPNGAFNSIMDIAVNVAG